MRVAIRRGTMNLGGKAEQAPPFVPDWDGLCATNRIHRRSCAPNLTIASAAGALPPVIPVTFNSCATSPISDRRGW